MVFSRDFLQHWEKQAAENLLGLESSLLGQDGHELSYIVFSIILPRIPCVNRKISVTDSLCPCAFTPVWYNTMEENNKQVIPMKKMLFLLNPCAGTKRANKVLAEILSIFNRADFDVHTYITAGPKDAISAVKRLAPGMDMVVCCGGDGTFNETVNGLMEADLHIPIGYIPAGSTNDFANSLHLSTDPVAAAKQIVSGHSEFFDVGKFGSRYFSYVASFGAFTKASYTTPQNVKNALGHTAYMLEGIRELSQIRKAHVQLVLDGETLEDDYLFGAVCNSTSVGGILTLDPNQVDMSDGMFEVLLVRAPRDLSEITECIVAVQKQQYNCRMMTFRSAKEITVFADADMFWTLDGEKANGNNPVTIVNLPHAIELIK